MPWKGVRRGARFEGAAAQGVRPGFADGLRGFEQLFAAFDRARPGDDQDFVAANFDAINVENRVLFLEFARGQFVRTRNRHDVVHAGQQGHRRGRSADVADHADHIPLGPADDVGAQPVFSTMVIAPAKFHFCCFGFHNNHHRYFSFGFSNNKWIAFFLDDQIWA
jgi:hypothetical protein